MVDFLTLLRFCQSSVVPTIIAGAGLSAEECLLCVGQRGGRRGFPTTLYRPVQRKVVPDLRDMLLFLRPKGGRPPSFVAGSFADESVVAGSVVAGSAVLGLVVSGSSTLAGPAEEHGGSRCARES